MWLLVTKIFLCNSLCPFRLSLSPLTVCHHETENYQTRWQQRLRACRSARSTRKEARRPVLAYSAAQHAQPRRFKKEWRAQGAEGGGAPIPHTKFETPNLRECLVPYARLQSLSALLDLDSMATLLRSARSTRCMRTVSGLSCPASACSRRSSTHTMEAGRDRGAPCTAPRSKRRHKRLPIFASSRPLMPRRHAQRREAAPREGAGAGSRAHPAGQGAAPATRRLRAAAAAGARACAQPPKGPGARGAAADPGLHESHPGGGGPGGAH